ncbi:hypothetical protein [Calycomorphotria hydatis]|uniref:hypothetical protein n=1 Tax=Calycomorphotria hydatis TaxID=2528027 RepID=UPI00119E57DC|nr:hypothetical protein [Calycomorphotria hydatis]
MSESKPTSGQPRPHIGMMMRCCNVYTRIYRDVNGDAFSGHCPRCAKPVRIQIVKEGGSSSRFFEAG